MDLSELNRGNGVEQEQEQEQDLGNETRVKLSKIEVNNLC